MLSIYVKPLCEYTMLQLEGNVFNNYVKLLQNKLETNMFFISFILNILEFHLLKHSLTKKFS